MNRNNFIDNIEKVDSFDDLNIYKKSSFTTKIGKLAMQEEKEKNKKLGIPSAFMQDGKMLFQLPDGTITEESPWKDD